MENSSGAALLVIDVQKGLFEKKIPIYQAGQLLENLRLLVRRAHAAGVPVFFIQHSTDKVLVAGSDEWQFHPQLQPCPGDTVIQKHHGNAFEDTPLQSELQARQVRRLLIGGLVTHGCVQATCQGALALGYQVILIEDGHSSYHKQAAKIIAESNARLVQAGAALARAAEASF